MIQKKEAYLPHLKHATNRQSGLEAILSVVKINLNVSGVQGSLVSRSLSNTYLITN